MEKQFFIDRTNTILNASSACSELKAAAKAWLDSIGTDGEKAAAEAYVAELEEDVTPLEKAIGFFASDAGVSILGENTAKRMLKKARDAELMGLSYCICPACNAGGAILDNKARFFELV